MSVIRLNYLDLSPEQRRAGAKAIKERIKASISNPDLTADQLEQLRKQLQRIEQWEAGVLEVKPVADVLPSVSTEVNPQFIQKLKELGTSH